MKLAELRVGRRTLLGVAVGGDVRQCPGEIHHRPARDNVKSIVVTLELAFACLIAPAQRAHWSVLPLSPDAVTVSVADRCGAANHR